MERAPVNVCVTGAAGQLAYSLLVQVGRGGVFGPHQPINLRLLDIPAMEKVLKGVVLELQDLASPCLRDILATTDANEAFKDCQVALMIGAFPRKAGMDRRDLLKMNASIFVSQGQALARVAAKNVKVVVVGNPANTNCLLMKEAAKSIPAGAFTALTRLDHNRAKAMIARKVGCDVSAVHNLIIWGNHSGTQYPDVSHGYILGANGIRTPIRQAVNDDDWLKGDFIKRVQKRGAEVIKLRGMSSAASAAAAVVDHVRDWWFGTPADDFVSVAVPSDGSYGIKPGVIFSFPCRIVAGKIEIVKGLAIDKFSREKLDDTEKELREEREEAFQFLN